MQGQPLVAFHPASVGPTRLRVLFITNMWPDSIRPHYGPFIQSQARSLENEGVAVDTVVIRGYASNFAYVAAIPQIRRLTRGARYDVVHIHTGHTAAVALIGRHRPTVLSYVGGDVLGNPDATGAVTRASGLAAVAFRQLGRFADATITKSVAMHEMLPAAVRVRNHVIPNGVDTDACAPRSQSAAREELGWDTAQKVALFVGNPDDPRKNVTLARAAIAELTLSGIDVRLHEAWGIAPVDIPRLMWAADALVFASRSEGSPNVVKEAMAAALPIVSTPVGDVPERLAGVPGCHVVAPDVTAFASALADSLIHGRTGEAREAVLPLSLSNVARQVMDVYEQVKRDRQRS